MTATLKADDLNLLVSLSCPNPQWEHIKFSFEDSPEEVDRYYSMQQYGKGYHPRQYSEDEGVLLVKAELVAAGGYPKVVFYERVCIEAASDTNELSNLWECSTKRLGSKVVKEVEKGIVVSTKQEHNNFNMETKLIYELVNLNSYNGVIRIEYLMDSDFLMHHAKTPHKVQGKGVYEIIQTQVVEKYLKDGVTEGGFSTEFTLNPLNNN